MLHVIVVPLTDVAYRGLEFHSGILFATVMHDFVPFILLSARFVCRFFQCGLLNLIWKAAPNVIKSQLQNCTASNASVPCSEFATLVRHIIPGRTSDGWRLVPRACRAAVAAQYA